MSLAERLLSKVEYDTNGGCWLCISALNPKGYARLKAGPKVRFAHRVAWEIWRGPIPPALFVLHRCDVPCCINPQHLFLGTNAENMADMVRKGRSLRRYGEANPRAKLTAANVAEIRQSTANNAQMARKFGVSTPLISYVRSRKVWKTA